MFLPTKEFNPSPTESFREDSKPPTCNQIIVSCSGERPIQNNNDIHQLKKKEDRARR